MSYNYNCFAGNELKKKTTKNKRNTINIKTQRKRKIAKINSEFVINVEQKRSTHSQYNSISCVSGLLDEMAIFGKSFLGFAAFLAGSCFIGYCLYFDKKRRSDPKYRQKIRERREKAELAAPKKQPVADVLELPDMHDQSALQRFFMQEIIHGEKDIENGDYESAVQHLANALVVCGQPSRLLQIFEKTIAPRIFAMLLQKMRELGNRIAVEHNLPIPGWAVPPHAETVTTLRQAVVTSSMDDLE